MKVVLHIAWRKTDLTPLAAMFPQLSFALTRDLDEFAREMADADILVMWSLEYSPDIAHVCKESAPRLKWIQFTTSGIDGALKSGGFRPGTIVTNCAGLRAVNLAEHAFTLLLFMARQMREIERARERRDWIRRQLESLKSLQGTNLLILGMGAIGQAVARRARAFDMRVLAVSRAYRADDLVQEVFSRHDAKAAFARADFIICAMPSTDETKGFLNADAFRAMKRDAYLVNVSRGDIIVESDLAAACRDGLIAGAALDVTVEEPLPASSPLWALDNVVISPHVGGQGNDETDLLIRMIAENLALYVEGKPLVRRVEY
jgi:phosphoglycerate dehydrogenase-like enzyme